LGDRRENDSPTVKAQRCREPRKLSIEKLAISPPGTRRGGPQACALTTSQLAGMRPSTRIAS